MNPNSILSEKKNTNWSPTNITVFVGVRSKEKTATLIGETLITPMWAKKG
jgi:hypothetical protein